MKSGKPRKISWRIAGIATLVLMLLLLLILGRGESEFSYVREKAKELNFDKAEILEFVRKRVEQIDYSGSFRGSLGTLWGESGNSFDRAQLLSDLLSFSGKENKIIREGGRFGVLLDETEEIIPLVEGDDLRSAVPAEVDDDFSIAFSLGSGEEVGDPYSGRVADHLRSPLLVSLREGAAHLTDGSGGILRSLKLEKEKRLVIRIEFRVAGEDPVVVRRELIAEGESGPESDHAVVFAPCEIGQFVFEKQVELWREAHGKSETVRSAYELVLAHWFRSDLMLDDLRDHFKLEAYYSVPRILIGSSYRAEGSEVVSRQALDLRLNEISVADEGEVASNFAITRAILEAELEAQVTSEVTGSRGSSAIEVFLGHLGDLPESSSKRIAGYEGTLNAFLRDTYPEAKLTLSLEGTPVLKVIHLPGGRSVKIVPEESLLKKMKEIAELPWTVLGKGLAEVEDFPELSYELEALLGTISIRTVDYSPEFAVEESPRIISTPSVRKFFYRIDEESGDAVVSFEQQLTEIESDGGYRYEFVDYWDEVNKRPQSLRSTLDVPSETSISGRGTSHWHNQQTIEKGSNPLALGVDVFRELKEKGHAEVIPFFFDRSAGEPMKLYNLGIAELEIQINQQKTPARAMWVGGGPAAKNLSKQAWDQLEAVDDPSTPYVEYCNRFLVLDNPEFPIYLQGADRFQASIPGKVISELNDQGVEGARVVIEGTNAEATSWPSGQFVLPIVKKPFDVFTVRITHPDFESWEEKLDFRNLETFERLRCITLKPRIPEDKFVWVDSGQVEEGVSQLSDERLQRFVREALEDDPSLIALVPREEIHYGVGRTRSWLLFNRNSHHITAVNSDGLHGAGAGEVETGAISAYSGFISSWYVYSGGKLDAMTRAMTGGDFSDLGHAHARDFALRFLENMLANIDSVFPKQGRANREAYRLGFLAGLGFFEANPAYRGE